MSTIPPCTNYKLNGADEIHEVSAEHVVYIPAGTPHWYDVLEAPFEFLCLVPNVPDQVNLVEPAED